VFTWCNTDCELAGESLELSAPNLPPVAGAGML
jgi:hypothetical protein